MVRLDTMTDTLLHAVPWTVCAFALFRATATDLKERIIPNELSLLVAASGLALTLAARPGQLWLGIAAAAGLFLGLGTLSRYELIGGGDVKLMSAAALLVPPSQVPLLLMNIALAGGLLGCAYLAGGYLLRRAELARPAIGPSPDHWLAKEGRRIAAGEPMPYALAVLGGVAAYMIRELPRCFFAISCSL